MMLLETICAINEIRNLRTMVMPLKIPAHFRKIIFIYVQTDRIQHDYKYSMNG